MDGIEATRMLRSLPKYRDIPIIAITAHAMASDRERCLRAGMNDYLVEPIERTALFAALRKHWGIGAESIPPAESKSPPGGGIENWPGLKMVEGVERVGGSTAIYGEILKTFCLDKADAAEKLQKFIAAGDWPAACAEAHSLKGAAANISAVNLAAAARSLESGIQNREPAKIEKSLARIQDELDSVAALSLQLNPSKNPEPQDRKRGAADKPTPEFRAAALRLQECLESLDPVESDRWLKKLHAASPKTLASDLGDLSHHLKNYHFDAAREILERISGIER
jgi:two-component system, sensor histidine kinase and response regulator